MNKYNTVTFRRVNSNRLGWWGATSVWGHHLGLAVTTTSAAGLGLREQKRAQRVQRVLRSNQLAQSDISTS